MSTFVEWPRAGVADPPMQAVAAWLARLRVDSPHQETREGSDAVPWIAESNEGYVVRMCQCGRWFIAARSIHIKDCGRHG